jgi:hypothetical protein
MLLLAMCRSKLWSKRVWQELCSRCTLFLIAGMVAVLTLQQQQQIQQQQQRGLRVAARVLLPLLLLSCLG